MLTITSLDSEGLYAGSEQVAYWDRELGNWFLFPEYDLYEIDWNDFPAARLKTKDDEIEEVNRIIAYNN